MSQQGKIEKVFYVTCGGLTDNSNCISDDLLTDSRLAGVMTKAKVALVPRRSGWVNDKERGWLCPKCVASHRMTEARVRAMGIAKNRAKK